MRERHAEMGLTRAYRSAGILKEAFSTCDAS
jgi:hypothetical protein